MTFRPTFQGRELSDQELATLRAQIQGRSQHYGRPGWRRTCPSSPESIPSIAISASGICGAATAPPCTLSTSSPATRAAAPGRHVESFDMIEEIDDDMRELIEAQWPDLAHKLPPRPRG